MASKAFPHVIMRNGWYHYHRRVPAAVIRNPAAWERLFKSETHFREKLGTKVYREALKAAAAMAEDFDKRVAEALSGAVAAVPVPTQRDFSAEALADVSKFIRERLILEWRNMILRAEISSEDAEYLHDRLDRIIHRPAATDEMTQLLGMKPADKAKEINETWGFDLSESTEQFGELVLAVKDGCVSARQGIQDLFGGKSLPDQPTSTLINRYSRAETGADSPTLSETVDRYLNEVRVRPKTAKEARSSLELFENLVGEKRLGELTRADFISYIEMLAGKQVGGRTAQSVARPASKGTVQKRVGALRTAINHAIEKDRHKGPNPAAGFKLSAWVKAPDKTVTPDKRPFKVSELNKVFEHPWFTGCQSQRNIYESGDVRLTGSYYWVPIMALYTGCRAAELGGLLLNEVHLDDTHPHIHIRPNVYRSTKWDHSRLVPLLDDLIELGFGAYAEAIRASGSDRLFPDWKAPDRTGDFDKDDARWSNCGPVRKLNRHVIDQQLSDVLPPGARREVTFHSFRGAFKSMLGLKRHNVPQNVINEVIGHSKTEMDKRYVHTVPLDETYPAIRDCGWPDLVIPNAPPVP